MGHPCHQNRLANATPIVPQPPCVRATSPHHRKLGAGFAALPQMAGRRVRCLRCIPSGASARRVCYERHMPTGDYQPSLLSPWLAVVDKKLVKRQPLAGLGQSVPAVHRVPRPCPPRQNELQTFVPRSGPHSAAPVDSGVQVIPSRRRCDLHNVCAVTSFRIALCMLRTEVTLSLVSVAV